MLILSPFLFNMHMNDLSTSLNAGCMVDDCIINHLADDMVVLSPCTAQLQQLINICSQYGVERDVK